MSQQLTFSSLLSAFALVLLALFARAGDIAERPANDAVLVQAERSADLDA